MAKILMSLLCCGMSLCYAMEKYDLVTNKKIGIFSVTNEQETQKNFFYHNTIENGHLYAVYGGKRGMQVSHFLAENFPLYFSKALGTIEERMKTACKNIDNDPFIKDHHKHCGSSAAIVFIKDNKAYCLHVGNDGIVVAKKNGTIDFFTYGHVPDRADEYVRIEDAKGLVLNGRVNGFLSVSRSFGHYWLDKRLIISEPAYQEIELTDQHKFLMLATKNLWKKVNHGDVALLLRTRTSGEHNMNLLAKLFGLVAIKRGSKDSVTVMVIDLLS